MEERMMEPFGPDWAHGPFASPRAQLAGIQVAALLAQLRVPLLRAGAGIEAHADLVQALAGRLMPDWSAEVRITVGPLASLAIQTSIRVELPARSLLYCWLADAAGGGQTATTPDVLTWNVGTVLHEITTRRRFLILTSPAGIADVTITHGGVQDWFWAVARHGRVHYSRSLRFL